MREKTEKKYNLKEIELDKFKSYFNEDILDFKFINIEVGEGILTGRLVDEVESNSSPGATSWVNLGSDVNYNEEGGIEGVIYGVLYFKNKGSENGDLTEVMIDQFKKSCVSDEINLLETKFIKRESSGKKEEICFLDEIKNKSSPGATSWVNLGEDGTYHGNRIYDGIICGILYLRKD